MNRELRPNMSIEDSENNNVDENSNDHQYNQYANYHDQYTNHQFQRPIQQQASGVAQLQQAGREQYYQRTGINRLQSMNDTVDNRAPSRSSDSHHRRNLSEDLTLQSSSLPPLPRNNLNDCAHHRLGLLGQPSNSTDGIPQLHNGRERMSDEVRVEGREHLHNFAIEQFRGENLDPNNYLSISSSYSNPSWRETGRNLRALADEFSKSPERKELRRRAELVNTSSLTCDNFFLLCSELFRRGEGGITQERIVVLFTFICDLAIQHVRQGAERFLSQLMTWSLRFLFERVCDWVQEAGGWGVVLSRGANIVYKWTLFVFAAFSIVALSIFIKKNLKHL